ncbi:S-layer homology domain-containing protein [Paenibacillus sp. Aloe-11]|uniref:S-layer homology domain-containing protein n=1 Tax=Paenibacillus sp. Aloe-11 TaxID=1050222 RepID=UPI00024EFA60|nr:S-layer homology domain-containing protein [Paenibacillus sp. Aloe-11]EHS54830.1 S-layer domain protein [Paenibacillus sp. Aloe-11]
MIPKKRFFRLFSLSLVCGMLVTGLPISKGYAAPEAQIQTETSNGKWMTGEYHTHTYQSDDAQESLTSVLDHAFEQNHLDWLALSDHLRMSSRDDNGTTLSGGAIPLSKGLALYQVPKIKELQNSGKYKDKIIFSGFEWDMPQYDHAGVGLLTDHPGSEEELKAINQFEYMFTNRSESSFDPANVAEWKLQGNRAYSTKQDTRTAIQWLRDHYPDSYVFINHPSRKKGSSSEIKISDIRDFNNLAPNIAFGFEGMPGNQMSPDRGETVDVYGGADITLAKVGGVWDALLGEGRKFWTFSNSDFHFNISKDRKYSSGYWPGEYSKNYTWVNGNTMKAVVDGMRSGKSFSVYGDLINALDFNITSGGKKEETGGNLQVTQGDNLQLTIRFKSPEKNNNEEPVQVDHVDLIAGDVTGPAASGTAEYTKSTNDSTKVLRRFTSNDWTTDAEGYHVITYKLDAASKNQYFRLRGTNLGINVPGETSNGEPLIDPKNTTTDNETRFAEINKRNYSDMWFYSNPIFVSVEPYSDQQAVDHTAATLSLGDTSQVTDDITLPQEGEHGTTIQWESSNPDLLSHDGHLLVRYPRENQPLTLKATITRGDVSVTKLFDVTVKGLDDITSVELFGSMKTADGQGYTGGQWTNQSVTASVYSSVYTEPVTSVKLELSMDKGEYQPYIANQPIEVSQEGKHTLEFRATDNLDRQAVLSLPINIDHTAPVITLKGTHHVTLKQGSSYSEQGADATDNFGVSGDVLVSGTVDTTTLGTYTLRYNVNDLAGNAAQEVVRTVSVEAGKKNDSDDNDSQSGGSSNSGSSNSSSGQASGGSSSGSVNGETNTSSKPANEQPSTMQMDVKAQQGSKGALNGVFSIDIPTGAVNSDGQVRAVVLPKDQAPAAGNLQLLSQVLELNSTSGNNLSKPVNLTVHYQADKVAQDSKPAVYYYNESQQKWIYLGGTPNEDGTVTVSFNRLAKFAVYDYKPLALSDLNGHWAQSYTDRLIGMNVIQGFENQTFRPNDQITRAQFAKILVNALGLHPSDEGTTFADDSKIPSWAKAQVAAAANAGLITGYKEQGKTVFKANQVITRAEMAVMISKALNSNASGSQGTVNPFRDTSSIPAWAQSSVNTAVSAGILNGYEDSTFQPDAEATRAETTAMIYKLLGALHI